MVLKNKILSKDFVHLFSIAFSIIILVLTYHYYYNDALFGSALISTETLGLFGGSKEDAVDSALKSVGYLGTVLFFLHYYQKKMLLQYYYEPDEEVSTNDEYLNEKEKSEGQSDNDKYQNLKDLKALLDAGVLTQEEFDTEKKKILNG